MPKTQELKTRPITCSHYKPTENWGEVLLSDLLPLGPRRMDSPPPEMTPLAWPAGEGEALTFHWLKQIPKEVQSHQCHGAQPKIFGEPHS